MMMTMTTNLPQNCLLVLLNRSDVDSAKCKFRSWVECGHVRCRMCTMHLLNADTNSNHDPTTNPDPTTNSEPTLTLSLTLIINLTLTLTRA